tara:strand:- start:315 stop:1487 length:1173 start_codon:yes stop_codon:yes gene_type:complete
MKNISIREIIDFSRIKSIPEKFLEMTNEDQKIYLLSKLKFVDWYKSIERLEYNTYLFYQNIGFIVNFEIINSGKFNQYFIKLDSYSIKIRIQDYFFIKFMNKLRKKSLIKKWFNGEYLELKKVLVEYPIYTHKYDKSYRVDYLLHISGDNYICIEFFENAHKCRDDPDFKKEKNRMYSLINDSDDRYKKILLFGIYWETKLNDEKYFKNYIKNIYQKIKEYQDIENEKIWCVRGINEFINRPLLSNLIYDAHDDDGIPVIPLNDINSIIEFRDEIAMNNHIKNFKEDVKQAELENNNFNDEDIAYLDDSDNEDEIIEHKKIILYDDNKLTLQGLSWYLNINKKYLKSLTIYSEIRNIQYQIMKGMVSGLKKQRDLIINLENNKIIGLYDY